MLSTTIMAIRRTTVFLLVVITLGSALGGESYWHRQSTAFGLPGWIVT